MSGINLLRGRANALSLVNGESSSVIEGEVVILSSSSSQFIYRTAEGTFTGPVFVVGETIAAAAEGKVYTDGFCFVHTRTSAVANESYLYLSTEAGLANVSSSHTAGCFGIALTSVSSCGNAEARIWNTDVADASLTANFTSMNELTTKADLLTSTGVGYIRKAVGSSGALLKADPSQDTGLIWAYDYKAFEFYIDGTLSTEADAAQMDVPANSNWVIDGVYARVSEASSGADVFVDILRNGTSLWTATSSQPSVAAEGTTGATVTPSTTLLAAGDNLKLDIDQVGSGTAKGTNLLVVMSVRSR